MKAEMRLQHHPYDTESWGVLIREAQVFFYFILFKQYLDRGAQFSEAGEEV